MNSLRMTIIIAATVISMTAGPLASSADAASSNLGSQLVARPAGAAGTVIVPDRFLRRWDPVTVFFSSNVGPAGGGPLDRYQSIITIEPSQPGAYTWIDARTLQFRPSIPWAPLTQYAFNVSGSSFRLTSLLSEPKQTTPQKDAEGLDAVTGITLSFPDPINPQTLAGVTTIELRPLPGSGGPATRVLTQKDFAVKVIERTDRDSLATYVLTLKTPVPLGHHATVRIRLALDAETKSVYEYSFATAEPFQIIKVGGQGIFYPIQVEGTKYTPQQALNLTTNRTLTVEFSSQLGAPDPIGFANLIRFEPIVDNITYNVTNKILEIKGDFAWEQVYKVSLVPTRILDAKDRPLRCTGQSELYFYFPPKPDYLQWRHGYGTLERFGPKMIPLEGRGYEAVDLRIFKIDPLDFTFWPFPEGPMLVVEDQRPPAPGEEPEPHTDASRPLFEYQLRNHLQALGAPAVSTTLKLPLTQEAGAASFGLDIAAQLEFISGAHEPGTYLVGIRKLDGSSTRSWIRIQCTDLCLTTVEEADQVKFVVTSLATGRPVSRASVTVEGYQYNDEKLITVTKGTTDAVGIFKWSVTNNYDVTIKRIIVRKDSDILVLDPASPPDEYRDNQWQPNYETWLQWTQYDTAYRGPSASRLVHIFTERPVYRPEEEVHIKGYARLRDEGNLTPVSGNGFLEISGPGELTWRYPVIVEENGSFYWKFLEDNLPTGTYQVKFLSAGYTFEGMTTFRKEAYRLPTFKVDLHAPERAGLDSEFKVTLTASYYAGGRVSARPVQWRVTQFPHQWEHDKLEGYVYSTTGLFTDAMQFDSFPRLDTQATTDSDGAAVISLDPSKELTAQPRMYVIEATVTGADDQTVTAVKRVIAVPPFALGLKVPRFIERAREITLEILAIGPDGKLLSGKTTTVRLLHRQWHSHLQAGDFTDGVARYITDTVDEQIYETTITTGNQPSTVTLPIKTSGVYIVELEAHDALGRAQVVKADLYAGGDEPVAWSRPVTHVFEVSADKEKYQPGDTAALVLKSPFQQAQALVVVEAPDGNRYEWLNISQGAGTYRLLVAKTYVPQIPVHFILMRGRIEGVEPQPGNALDLGKPITMASTKWLKVEPVENRLNLDVTYPERARPGETIEVTVALSDPKGRPLTGEVTLWLVDQAVLALGKEQALDPVPAFITPVFSTIGVHDTRNLTFGFIPFAQIPGGDGSDEPGDSLFGRITIRKTFKPVPYYNPAIKVGPSGRATVTIELPDNLTNFSVRAKAVSGPDRFGFATGLLAVRLPVIVQPALPRFVRPGDRFEGSAIGRIVEGEGGPGRAEIALDGARLVSEAIKDFIWDAETPMPIRFQVEVPDPVFTADGVPELTEMKVRVAIERRADKFGDAFEIPLPIIEDRHRVVKRAMSELQAATDFSLPPVAEEPRSGTVVRSILVSDQPALVKMTAGLRYLMEYPYGCLEQRLSEARARLASQEFHEILKVKGVAEFPDRAVLDTLEFIPAVLSPDGLCSYWPGSDGYVTLTAWTVQFMVEARAAGYSIDEALFGRLVRTLEQALRSDYSRFIQGEQYSERCWALLALAQAGYFKPSYAAELARKAQFLNLESVAQVLMAFEAGAGSDPAVNAELTKKLWDGIVFRLHQGNEQYGGLRESYTARSGLVLPGETRTLAEITQALKRVASDDKRLAVLVSALVNLGRDDGWGSTNSTAAALKTLTELLQPPFLDSQPQEVEIGFGADRQKLAINSEAPLAYTVSNSPAEGTVRVTQPAAGRPLLVRAETSYIPSAPGSAVSAQAQGFVVTRELLQVVSEDEPLLKHELKQPGMAVNLKIGDVIEDHVQVVNPKDANFVAIVVPLAAGLEPLNPDLATAPPEARPSGTVTLEPSYMAMLDDSVSFYFDSLPKGTYDFYFRTRATTPGVFIQPAARSELMYDAAVYGNSFGASIEIIREEPQE